MSRLLGLFRIEARRNEGLFLFPALIGLAWWMVARESPTGVVLWTAAGENLRNTLIFLGPIAAGLSAWVAVRNRRRRMDELLSSTPLSPATRELTAWAATTLWVWLAYLVVGVAVVVVTALRATWGWPSPSMAVGLLAIGAYSAIGYAFGSYVRTAFAVPVLPVALYVAQSIPTYLKTPWENLVPVDFNGTFPLVWYNEAGVIQISFWLVGIATLGLTLVALRSKRGVLQWGILVVAAAITALSAQSALGLAERTLPQSPYAPPYEPVCAKGHMEVCVHPAYEALLSVFADQVERVAEPLAGIPGVPTRAVQGLQAGILPDGTLVVWLHDGDDAAVSGAGGQVASMLVRGENAFDYEPPYGDIPENQAQDVVIDWLAQPAGSPGHFWASKPAERTALERFGALDPEVRRTWLEEHYADLRDARLTLEDLP